MTRIRPATAADGPALAQLMIDARKAAVPAIPPSIHDDDDVRQWMQTVVLAHSEVWLVEEAGGPPLGLVVVRDDWVEHLFVAPARTGGGLGTRLLDHAKAQRPDGLQLWTFETNVRAQRFYEQRGFRVVRRTDGSTNEERSPDVLYAWPGRHPLASR